MNFPKNHCQEEHIVGQGNPGAGELVKRAIGFHEDRAYRFKGAVQAELPKSQEGQLQRQLRVQPSAPLAVCVKDARTL